MRADPASPAAARLPAVALGRPALLAPWTLAGPVPGTAEGAVGGGLVDALFRSPPRPGERFAWKGGDVRVSRLGHDLVKPAGFGRIDLDPLLRSEPGAALVMLAALACPAAGLFRVHLGRLRSAMRIGSALLREGDFVRLAAGTHLAAVITDGRKDYNWDRLFICPRLVPCRDGAPRAFHAGQVAVWKEAVRAARTWRGFEPRMLPQTLVGVDGFVRVGRTAEGFWSFVDANGRPFFYQGVTSINRAGTQGGRRAAPGPYAKAVDARYGRGPRGREAFVRSCIARLRRWGFNGMGSWTTPEFFEKGMFYTDILEFLHGYPRLAGMKIVDVFDPGWLEFIDRKAREICTPQRGNRQLVGYFTENEIGFPGVGAVQFDALGKPVLTGVRPSLLQVCLGEAPAAHCRRAAWEFVLRRHGSPRDAGRAWGLGIRDASDVRRLNARGDVFVSDGFRADADAFAAFYAETFFRCSAQAIRRYDPNHLILGCRWAGAPEPAIMEAESRWVDVISLNNYQDMFHERIGEYHNPLDLPILIGEFCWNDDSHMSVRMPFEDPVGLTIQERMLESGRKALLRLCAHPNIAGWTWYRWVAGNPMGSPRTCGMVDERDEPHPWNTVGIPMTHALAEPARMRAAAARAKPVRPFAGRLVVVLQRAAFASGHGQRHAHKVVFGAVCSRSGVAPDICGYGITGRVNNARFSRGCLRFSVNVRFTEEVFRRGGGKGRYAVTLDRDRDGHLTGRYAGAINGEPICGAVSAWRE